MKPFDAKELVARVKAVLRRYQVGNQRLLRQIRENVSNTRELRSILPITPSLLTAILWRCRRKNWNFFISSHPLRIRYSQESSYWIVSGAMNISAIPVPSMCTSNVSEKIKDHNGWSLSTVWGIGYKFEVK